MAASYRFSLRSIPLLLLACSPGLSGPLDPPGELARSAQLRTAQPAPPADLDATVAGNTAFALDLYRALGAQPGNVVFSPYSITAALAMTYAGARTTTATAFESTLHLGLPASRFHRGMNTLDAALRSHGKGAEGQDGKPFQLAIENQLFAQQGSALVPDFLDLLAVEYGAGVRLLDFVHAAEPARLAIDAWVATDTGGLIPELLAPGALDASTRLVLVDAVYFDAAWKTKFDPNLTAPGLFHLRDGSTRQVRLMAGAGISGGQAVVDGTQVIELPYDGGEVSLVLLVPAAGQLTSFEQQLTPAALSRQLAALQPGALAVAMPKFAFGLRADLGAVLDGLGLGVAFSDAADFSGISTAQPLRIGGVMHQAVIRTDEAGTQAAAATAVTIGVTSVPDYIVVDRPFLFAIRDVATGALIFLGRVDDPAAASD